MARNSEVILATLKLDRTYKSVIDYSESDMYSLVWANKNQYVEKCNYLREEKAIEVQLTMAQCLTSNYLAFRNTDYEYKWFFAFIDKVEYVNNAVSRIYFTIDIWSTWHDYWSKKDCYIIRQHQNTDVAGDNTVPEGLEHGEYIQNAFYNETKFKSYYFVVVSNISLTDPTNTNPITSYHNVVVNGASYVCSTSNGLKACINAITSTNVPEQGKIWEVYIAPRVLFPDVTPPTSYGEITSSLQAYYSTSTIFNSKPTSLDNYYVVNKKLLTYPYCYILADNHVGNTTTWKYENITSNDISVTYYGIPTVGCSIISSLNYDKVSPSGFKNSLIGAKYPTLGWREDSYTNWLTQNAVNNQARAVTSAGSIAIGTALLGASLFTGGTTALAGAGLIASGTMSAIEAGSEYYQHQIEPDSIKGLISAGDAFMSMADLTFSYTGMSIKQDYAQKIDKYFTRYGYKQNAMQTPLWGDSSYRRRWNYIQIAGDSEIGVPITNATNGYTINTNDMEMINNMFRAGITIFKLYPEYNDFDLSNEIVTPTP